MRSKITGHVLARTAAVSVALLALVGACTDSGQPEGVQASGETTTSESSTTTTVSSTTTSQPVPLPDDPAVTFDLDETVTPEMAEELRAGVLAARRIVDGTSPLTFHASHDRDVLAQTCSRAFRTSVSEMTGMLASASFAGPGVVCFGPLGFHRGMSTAAHEATHVVQWDRAGITFTNNPDMTGASWLFEGHATYVASKALVDRGVTTWDKERQRLVASARTAVRRVEDKQQRTDYRHGTEPITGAGYDHYALAMEMLIAETSEQAVHQDFWIRAGQIGWQPAFIEVFGMTPDEFRARADEWFAERYPPL